MISAKKAWKMATSTKYDKIICDAEMLKAELHIKNAARRGETCIKQELSHCISGEKLFATYVEILKRLKKKNTKQIYKQKSIIMFQNTI